MNVVLIKNTIFKFSKPTSQTFKDLLKLSHLSDNVPYLE